MTGNVLIQAANNVLIQAANNGGQIILQGDSGQGGQVTISAGIGGPSWSEPDPSQFGADDGTIWLTTKPCAGHFNMGGYYIGKKTKPSRFMRAMHVLILGWEWTEERSDDARRTAWERLQRSAEMS